MGVGAKEDKTKYLGLFEEHSSSSGVQHTRNGLNDPAFATGGCARHTLLCGDGKSTRTHFKPQRVHEAMQRGRISPRFAPLKMDGEIDQYSFPSQSP